MFNIRHFKDENFIIKNDIDSEIEENISKYDSAFAHYAKCHNCSSKGCGTCIVLDGHLKAHRKICKKSDCRNDPKKGMLFCADHLGSTSFKINANINEEDLETSDSFHVENIVGKRYVKKEKYYQYHVKWLGYDECTWESHKNIPRILIEQYNRKGTIHSETYIVDERKYKGIDIILVMFEDETSIWLPKCALSVNPEAYDIDIELDEEGLESCNTKKDKVRFHKRTAGILVGGYPCGTMIFVKEIFGSESISQVSKTLDEIMSPSINCIAYDDACHLSKFVKKRPEQFAHSFENVEIKVDKFHFKNHIDPWCKTNCNPYKCALLDNVNTEIMEQFFSWIARFSYTLKYMNRFRFHFFILDIIDKHNFVINGLNPFHNCSHL